MVRRVDALFSVRINDSNRERVNLEVQMPLSLPLVLHQECVTIAALSFRSFLLGAEAVSLALSRRKQRTTAYSVEVQQASPQKIPCLPLTRSASHCDTIAYLLLVGRYELQKVHTPSDNHSRWGWYWRHFTTICGSGGPSIVSMCGARL